MFRGEKYWVSKPNNGNVQQVILDGEWLNLYYKHNPQLHCPFWLTEIDWTMKSRIQKHCNLSMSFHEHCWIPCLNNELVLGLLEVLSSTYCYGFCVFCYIQFATPPPQVCCTPFSASEVWNSLQTPLLNLVSHRLGTPLLLFDTLHGSCLV